MMTRLSLSMIAIVLVSVVASRAYAADANAPPPPPPGPQPVVTIGMPGAPPPPPMAVAMPALANVTITSTRASLRLRYARFDMPGFQYCSVPCTVQMPPGPLRVEVGSASAVVINVPPGGANYIVEPASRGMRYVGFAFIPLGIVSVVVGFYVMIVGVFVGGGLFWAGVTGELAGIGTMVTGIVFVAHRSEPSFRPMALGPRRRRWLDEVRLGVTPLPQTGGAAAQLSVAYW